MFLYIITPYHNSSIRSEEGITLERSAFQSLSGGQLALSTQLTKLDYLNFDWDR